MRTRGVTLIELMIVVCIIAIIAALAIPNMLRARMAANEVSAIATCRIFAEAQELYRRTDYDLDGILEYSTRLKGDYSLLETKAGLGDLTLIDRNVANAEGNPGVANGRAGYVFQVLTSQGLAAPGGAHSYIVKGNMVSGYGLSAVPEVYELSGRSSFMIGINGVTYLRDTGTNLHQAILNPDAGWATAE